MSDEHLLRCDHCNRQGLYECEIEERILCSRCVRANRKPNPEHCFVCGTSLQWKAMLSSISSFMSKVGKVFKNGTVLFVSIFVALALLVIGAIWFKFVAKIALGIITILLAIIVMVVACFLVWHILLRGVNKLGCIILNGVGLERLTHDDNIPLPWFVCVISLGLPFGIYSLGNFILKQLS